MHPAPADTDLVELVIPCLNEETALPALLAGVPSGWAVIVVDNGSRDHTADVARRAGAVVVHEPQPGYEPRHRAASGDARHSGGAGRGRIDPRPDLTVMVDLVATGRTDLCCGARQPVTRAAWPVHARLGNRVLAATLSLVLGLDLHDIAPVRVALASSPHRPDGHRSALRVSAGNPAPRQGRRLADQRTSDSLSPAQRRTVEGDRQHPGTLRALRDFAGVLVANRGLLRRWAR